MVYPEHPDEFGYTEAGYREWMAKHNTTYTPIAADAAPLASSHAPSALQSAAKREDLSRMLDQTGAADSA